jgi:DUF4097 and DUF4098 domain-containing protein YvlB
MPTFDTPEPIAVDLDISMGDVRITASDRTDTIVEVRPSRQTERDDVDAAEHTRVEFARGCLTIKAPKSWKRYTPFSDGGSVDVSIELPTGSSLLAEAAMAALHVSGRLGATSFKSGMGDIAVEDTGTLELRTGAGAISVGRAGGGAYLTTGSGALRVDSIDGTALLKNSNGATWVGDVSGDLRVNAATGDIAVDRAHAGVTARTANGDVRLGEVSSGTVVAETGSGGVEVGVADGSAAFLDLNTGFGRVDSDLSAADGPKEGEQTVEVRARSGAGDISIRRKVK